MNELLQNIRKQPGLYLGKPTALGLKHFLEGYSYRCYELTNHVRYLYPYEFTIYLNETYKMHTCGAIDIVYTICEYDDEKAFWKFFELLDAFISSQ